MKSILTLLLFISIVGCEYLSGNSIDQKIMDRVDGEKVLGTFVFYHNEIVKSWFDPIENLTDSIVHLRQRQADSCLNILKQIKYNQ